MIFGSCAGTAAAARGTGGGGGGGAFGATGGRSEAGAATGGSSSMSVSSSMSTSIEVSLLRSTSVASAPNASFESTRVSCGGRSLSVARARVSAGRGATSARPGSSPKVSSSAVTYIPISEARNGCPAIAAASAARRNQTSASARSPRAHRARAVESQSTTSSWSSGCGFGRSTARSAIVLLGIPCPRAARHSGESGRDVRAPRLRPGPSATAGRLVRAAVRPGQAAGDRRREVAGRGGRQLAGCTSVRCAGGPHLLHAEGVRGLAGHAPGEPTD